MFIITDHKPEQLQLRSGKKILNYFKKTEQDFIVLFQTGDDSFDFVCVDVHGTFQDDCMTPYDVVLKPKKKKLVAPFCFKLHATGKAVFQSSTYVTREEAQKQRGFLKWMEQLAFEIDDDERNSI